MSVRSNYYVYGLYAKGRQQSLFYIGKGTKRRMFRHTREEPADTHKRRILNKYKCYPMLIMGGISENFAYALEEKLVTLYKNLSNKTGGGRGSPGHRPSKKTLALRSTKGYKRTEATKQKIKKARAEQIMPKGQESPNYGKKHIVPGNSNRRLVRVDLNYVAYHIWAQSISGLTRQNYCDSVKITLGLFKDWKSKRYKNIILTPGYYLNKVMYSGQL